MELEDKIVFNIDVMLARRKMSVTELSERVGITLANMSILKNGKAKAIRISTLAKLCEALDCQPGDLLDYRIEHAGRGYTELMEYKAARIAERLSAGTQEKQLPAANSNKEQYLKNKQNAADARKKKAQIERLKKECSTLETELEQIDAELFGSAASDYVRAAELCNIHISFGI